MRHTIFDYIIDRLAIGGVSPERILDLAEHEARKEDEWTPDPEVMQALILGLGRFSQAHLPELIQSRHLREFLQGQYASNSSAAVHSAIEWLYRRAGKKLPDAKRPFKEETPGDPPTPSWSGTKNGHTMVAFRDVELLDEPDPCSFAISTTEVTVEQFLKFLETEEAMELPDNFYSSELGYNKMVDDYKKLATEESDRLPAFGVSWLLAARYCNWLSSETPHLDGDQWCYNPTATSAPQMITANSLERLGYRLPTVKEWQYACQAKSTTKYNFGDSYELLFQHATKELVSHWRKRHVINVGGNNQLRFQPVAELMPNGFGLFDVHGNIAEWCHPANPNPDDGFFPMRGGAFADKNTNFFASEKTEPQPPELDFIGFERYGFRPARTLP